MEPQVGTIRADVGDDDRADPGDPRPAMRLQPTFGRRRVAALVLGAGLATAAFGAPSSAVPWTSAAPSQENEGQGLKAEYDEIIGEEAALLNVLEDATAESEAAAQQLRDLQAQTKTKQVELIGAQLELQEAEELLDERLEARAEAEERVEVAQDRLRGQIVAAYVAGGDDDGLLEALLSSGSGEELGQALAYGRAVSGSTEQLVEDLDDARAAQAEAAKAAREARSEARSSRDAIDEAAAFLASASAQQGALVQELNLKVLAEATALREVQGRKALVEGRINAMSTASDGVAMILAARQADQPDWLPGSVEITTPTPGILPGSKYGPRQHPILGITRLHAGVDLGGPTGTPIHAPADGVVVLAEVRGGYGNTVVLDHGNSLGTLFGHNSQLLVSPGDLVERGDVIALMGSTGLSTGPHSHFETRLKGLPVDPEGVIDFAQEVDYDELDD